MSTVDRIIALADQIQEACTASGLEVVGFTVMVNNDEENAVTTESRARIGRQNYMGLLGNYVLAEMEDREEDS